MDGLLFDLLADLSAPTDYSRSFVPAVIADGKSARSQKREHLLRQFQRARQVGMGISTAQILRCLCSTVGVGRVWELVQQGWKIVNHGRCEDGTDLFVLEADEQGPPVEKLLGWEGSIFTTGTRTDAHSHHVALSPEDRESLDKYMQACLRAWVDANKPAWSRYV